MIYEDNSNVLLSTPVGEEPKMNVRRYDRRKKEHIQVSCSAIIHRFRIRMKSWKIFDSVSQSFWAKTTKLLCSGWTCCKASSKFGQNLQNMESMIHKHCGRKTGKILGFYTLHTTSGKMLCITGLYGNSRGKHVNF